MAQGPSGCLPAPQGQMLRLAQWTMATLQAGAVLLVLVAAIQGQLPRASEFDMNAMSQLAGESGRYLDAETTGSIQMLMSRP